MIAVSALDGLDVPTIGRREQGSTPYYETNRELLHDRTIWIAVGGWVLFAWFRMWQATISPSIIWQDSKVYESVASHSFWSAGFWFGQRPPLAPLLWKLTGSSGGFVIAQALVSISSWTFLAWTIGRLAPGGWRRVVVCWAILAFATVTPIVMWDRSVLSESLALSGLAVLFATVVRLAIAPSLLRLISVVLAALWCGIAHDSGIAIVVLLGFSFLVYALTGIGLRLRIRFLLSSIMALSLFGVSIFCMVAALQSGRTSENVENVYFARVFPYPNRVAWFAAHGMPQSNQIDKLARDQIPPRDAAKVVFIAPTSGEFTRLYVWMNDHGGPTYIQWMAQHPWYIISEALSQPNHSFNFANGDLYFYAAPNRTTSAMNPIFWAPWPWLLPISVGAFFAVFRRGRWTDRAIWAVSVLAFIGIPAMLIAWNSDAQEVTRHTIEGLAELRLGILVALLVAVFGCTPLSTENRGLRVKRAASACQLSEATPFIAEVTSPQEEEDRQGDGPMPAV